MSVRQRISLSAVAAAIQLVGFILLVRFLPTADFPSFLPILLGFYLSSWLGLTLGETAVGVSSGRRTWLIAALPAGGLIGLVGSDFARGGVLVLVGFAMALNLVASWLLGRRPANAADTGAARGAWLLATLAATFVLWQIIVESVRIRYAVEARIIGDARTLISAQEAYAGVNFGFYDTPECLQAPRACLRTPLPPGIVFLSPEPWSGSFRYYRRRFVPGPAVDPKDRPPGASPSSLRRYAYVAVPAEPDGLRGLIRRMAGLSLAGARAVCADSTGMICVSDGAAEPPLVDGICAPDCQTP